MRMPLPESRVSGIARRSRAGYRAAGGGSTFAAGLSFGRNSRPLSAAAATHTKRNRSFH
ncbi:hypothetical protein [Burkholderia cepacia]|uniref:hypothetical protein n=1 Tax=Burkholderia cepacia TaxID=292 RepID=UPI00163A53FF|nr:hypothetical protein [Burkholderia cepacia]